MWHPDTESMFTLDAEAHEIVRRALYHRINRLQALAGEVVIALNAAAAQPLLDEAQRIGAVVDALSERK